MLVRAVCVAAALAALSAQERGAGISAGSVAAERLRLMQEKRAWLDALKAKVVPLMAYDIDTLQAAVRVKVVEAYGGASVLSTDPLTEEVAFLGTIEDEFAPDSIFNPYGSYGSPYAAESIWNEYGSYGGAYASSSPFNRFSTSPPVIVKGRKVIGRLTVNKLVSGGLDPAWLRSYFTY